MIRYHSRSSPPLRENNIVQLTLARRPASRTMSSDEARPSKRSKTSHTRETRDVSISPPPRRGRPIKSDPVLPRPLKTAEAQREHIDLASDRSPPPESIPSPFKLTHIRDLPADQNVDAVRLKDILGDVMIKECWQFNFLFDVDWLM